MGERREFLAGMAGLAATTLPAIRAAAETAGRKRIYIAADDHTDYMWTADEMAYRDAFLRTIDHYLELADQTDGEPSDFQSRWNCDGLLWLREFENHRSPEQVRRLIRRIESGHVSVPMTMLVSCYGGTPTEAVLRGLLYGGIVERRYGIMLDIAVAMENQTLPLGLVSLWAGSGVRYSWKGICGCASKLKQAGTREHDVYWWVGPDGQRVLMKWYSLAAPVKQGGYANEGPGGYAEARYPSEAIEFVDRDGQFRAKNPHDVIGLFGQGWDDLETVVPLSDTVNSFPAVAQSKSNAKRRVVVSNELDYFQDMAATHGDDLPEVSVSFGNEWELYTASLAEVSASVKRATEKLRAAEAMAVAVQQHRPVFMDDLVDARHQCWVAFGLYWEHDWTADGPITRPQRAAWQRKIASQIVSYVDTLHDRSRRQLGELLGHDGDTAIRRVYVFNPLSWTRTDYAEIEVDRMDVVAFESATGNAAPSQVIRRDDRLILCFLVKNVPALGHVVYSIGVNAKAGGTPTVTYADGWLRSRTQELQVGLEGEIKHWRHNNLLRPLIGDEDFANRMAGVAGTASIECQGEVSTTIRVDVPTLRRKTRITLFADIDRVEIDNHIRENFSEILTWSFRFGLQQPTTRHEEVGAIVTAGFAADGGDYADRNARTDWLTMNHFVAMQDRDMGVTISNRDCLFFHLGDDVGGPMQPKSSELRVLAGGQVDGENLGIQSQGGDSSFRQRFALNAYSKTGSRVSDVESMKHSMEFQNPLVTGDVSNSEGLRPIDEPLFEFESDSTIVWAVKPSEEATQPGVVVRLWNLSDQPSLFRLSCDRMTAAMRVTHVETDAEPVATDGRQLVQTLPPRAMQSFKLIVQSASR